MSLIDHTADTGSANRIAPGFGEARATKGERTRPRNPSARPSTPKGGSQVSNDKRRRGFVRPQAAANPAAADQALWDQRKADLEAAERRRDASEEAWSAATKQVSAEAPAPDELMIMRHDGQGGRFRALHATEDDIQRACVWSRTGEAAKEGQLRADRLLRLAEAWKAERKAAQERLECAARQEAWERAIDDAAEARKALAATPAPDLAAAVEKIALCSRLLSDCHADSVADPWSIGEAMAGEASDGMGFITALYLDLLRSTQGAEAVTQIVAHGAAVYADDMAAADALDHAHEAKVDEDGFSARTFWREAKAAGAFFYRDGIVHGWRFRDPATEAAKALRAKLAGDLSKQEAVMWVARADAEGGLDD